MNNRKGSCWNPTHGYRKLRDKKGQNNPTGNGRMPERQAQQTDERRPGSQTMGLRKAGTSTPRAATWGRAGADRPPGISRKTKIQIFMWNFLFFPKHWPLSQKIFKGTSLVVQGLRSCLAIQGTQVRFLVGQLRLSAAPRPVRSGACRPQPEGPSTTRKGTAGNIEDSTCSS